MDKDIKYNHSIKQSSIEYAESKSFNALFTTSGDAKISIPHETIIENSIYNPVSDEMVIMATYVCKKCGRILRTKQVINSDTCSTCGGKVNGYLLTEKIDTELIKENEARRQKALEIIEIIKKTRRIAKKELSNKSPKINYPEEINKMQADINRLQEAINDFPTMESELKKLGNNLKDLEKQKELLQEKRSELGLFQSKEKKEIDEQIRLMNKKIEKAEDKYYNLQYDLDINYGSLDQMKAKLNKLERDKESLQLGFDNYKIEASKQTPINEFSDAIKTMNADDLLKKAIYEQEPHFGKLLYGIYPNPIIHFGNYSYPDDAKPEPLEWQILEMDESKALLLCKDIINTQFFDNQEDKYLTWKESSVRNWLNNKFVRAAFSRNEYDLILPWEVVSNYYQDWAYHYEYTIDRIFMLSEKEYKKYQNTQNFEYGYTYDCMRKFKNNGDHKKGYWLRDVYQKKGHALYVTDTSDIYYANYRSLFGVRPALWVKREALS